MQKDVVLKCSKICFNILHKDCSGGLQYITNAGNLPDLDFKISKVVTSLNNEHVQATLSQYSKLIVEKKLTLLVHDLNFKVRGLYIQPGPSMTFLVYSDPSKTVYSDPPNHFVRITINRFRRITINQERH